MLLGSGWMARSAVAGFLVQFVSGAGCAGNPDEDAHGSAGALAGPAPDLVVTLVSDPPAQAVTGGTVAINVRVENVGNAAASLASQTRYFLSPDQSVDPTDRKIATTTQVPALDVGADDEQVVTLAVPAGVSAGSYFIIACADRRNVVLELNDRNNCSASSGTVSVSGADLVVEAIGDPPPVLEAGALFSVGDSVRNGGSAPAASSILAYYLSPVPERGPLARRLVKRRVVGPLDAGAVSSGSVTLQMLALPPGSYYLLACADLQRTVAETDETNNCTASAGTVTYPVVDLAVALLGDPPAVVAQAGSFELLVATVNLGNSPVPASETRFALSLDEVSGDDIPLRGAMTTALQGGSSHSAVIRLAVEFTTPQAEYFVIACADATSVVAELSETNNCRTSGGRVAVTGAQPADDVSVHLLGRVGWPPPRAGEPVLVHDAAGALVARLATDPTGTATADVPAGGSITVVEAGPRFLTTFHGVSSGDDLTVGDLWRADAPIGTATVLLAADPPPGSYYSLEGPCAGGISTSAQVTVYLYEGCGPATRPLMAMIASLEEGTLSGSILDPAITLVPGGTATFEGSVDPPASFSIAVSGLPADVPWIDLEMGRLLGSNVLYHWSTFPAFPVDAGQAVGSIIRPRGGDGLLTHLIIGHWEPPHGVHEILDYRITNEMSLETDVSADLVARPTNPLLVRGELVPGGPLEIVGLTWNMGEGPPVDGMLMRIEKLVGDGTPSFAWTVVMPPSPTGFNEVRLAQLPADLVPVWAGIMISERFIASVDSPATSYEEFRRDAEPQRAWKWRWWQPGTPGKVKIGSHSGHASN